MLTLGATDINRTGTSYPTPGAQLLLHYEGKSYEGIPSMAELGPPQSAGSHQLPLEDGH